jgi:ubiquinone/menaquinone biosynthesis C-methylase UbiE
VLGSADLGDDVLEIGPGPGITTPLVRERSRRVTAVEIDPWSVRTLREKFRADPSITVVEGDATRMPFEDGRFSSAVCFTMLHHVPSTELQDRLLSEVDRVLRPGGTFIGSDSTDSLRFRLYHMFDTCVPIDPSTLPDRLRAAGFTDPRVDAPARGFRFRAMRS